MIHYYIIFYDITKKQYIIYIIAFLGGMAFDLRMVDQMEKAEVAETKRSVFRALTRLRGAALEAFDGIAKSQESNIERRRGHVVALGW